MTARRLAAHRRTVAVAVATALLPVAGLGVASAAHGTSGRTSGATTWTVSALPLRAHTPYSFSEPGIAVGPHDVLLANACTANSGSPSTFWRSRDGGRTWSTGFGVGSSAIGCGDADAAVGADGYEYSLTLGTGVDVYRSRDGRAWQGPATFPPPHGADQPDRPWLVLVPHHPAEVLVFNSEVGGNIVEWRSDDHGATFAGPTPVTGGANSQAALALGSRPLVEPTAPSRLHLFYETVGGAAVAQSMSRSGPSQFPLTQLWEASSTDGGRTWSNTMVLDVSTAFGVSQGSIGHLLPATAVDRDGNVYVVLSVRLGSSTATRLYLLHTTRGGRWSRPVRVDVGAASNVMPAVAVAAPGRVFLSWYASSAPDYDDPHARWVELVATVDRALGSRPAVSAQRLSGAAPVHVGPVDGMGAIGYDLGQNWGLRDFQSIVVGDDGRPHVTWASDYGTGRTYVATTSR